MRQRDTERHLSIGAAIERAAAELPDGYDLMIEIEKDAGTVTLLIPPIGDDENGQALHDWDGDHFGYQINKAIDHAIEHHKTPNDLAKPPGAALCDRSARLTGWAAYRQSRLLKG